MAAPSSTKWGTTINDYGSVGIYTNVYDKSATESYVYVEVWLWTKYSCTDSSNAYYWNDNSQSATTLCTSNISIKHTVSSGAVWNTANQTLLGKTTLTIAKGASATTRYTSAKLTGIDRVGGTMTCTASYTIPALPKYTLTLKTSAGVASFTGGGSFTYGTTATTKCTASTGYHLTKYVGTSYDGTTTSTWQISNDSSVTSDDENWTMIVNRTVTAYAEPNTYTVTYNANGGSGSMSASTATYNANFLTKKNTFTKTGYNFNGWNQSANGTGTVWGLGSAGVYESGTSWKWTYASSITLYAQWKPNTYPIYYNANGGTGEPSTGSYLYNSGATISTVIPSRQGYSFLYWTSEQTGGVVFYPGDRVPDGWQGFVLYAQWTLLQANTYLKVDGVWKQGIVYKKVDGVWKQGIVYIKQNSNWKGLT